MSIYKTSVNKPITTILIFVAIIILGLFSLSKLPIDQLPEMEPPYVSIMTTYPGANSSEIETNVTKLLENALNSVDGLKEIRSTSRDNMSIVMLEFEWGMNLDETINDIRTSIDFVYDRLPESCSRPMILKFNTSMMPIMQYAITANESYPGVEKILEDNLLNVLNRIDGIGNLSLSGAPKRYVYIELDPNKLDAYNLSVEMVGQAVSSNNFNLASGSMKMGKEQYQLRVQSEYVESSEIKDIVVFTTPQGKQIFVRDIAEIRDTIKDISLDEKINGKDGARLIIMKQSGANTVQVCKDVQKQIELCKKNLPPDINIKLIYDTSENIENAIFGLGESIVYALIFVVLVILFFLGRWRATFIIALTIPISLVTAFIYLALAKSSINIISLSSLTIAIGMVVDDAIVVLENITRHVDRGSGPREAAIYATNEVWVSVIATTLVLVAVFVPLTMLGGQAGVMFKELGWIVTIVICTSAVAAITITPMLASKLLKIRNNKTDDTKKRRITYDNTVVRFLGKIDVWYANILRWCLHHKKITILAVILLFVASMLPLGLGYIGTNFMPQDDTGRMTANIELQSGTRVEESMKVAREAEQRIIEAIPEVELISTSTGSNDESGISSLFSSTSNNKISINIRCTKKYNRERTIFELAEVVRTELAQIPQIINSQVSTSRVMGMGGNTVNIEIYGYDFDKTNKLALEVKEKLKSVKGARDITISRENDQAEIQILFNKEKLAMHGLSSVMASTYVRNRINGMQLGYLRENGEEYIILARLKENYRNSITDIENISLMTNNGKKIKLKELAEIKEYWCPPNIQHKRRERIVEVKITPQDVPLNQLVESVNEVLKDVDVPNDVLVNVGGAHEDQQKTFSDMLSLFILIVLLVYIVMASQFESFSKPFIIMMAIPFAISGVVIALLISGVSLDMIGALGVILLAGIVVKNGIVLVDYINLMRDRGYPLYEAIALSGQSRLRPVLMTTITTILGMVPMTLSTSEGSEMWVPMGIVVIGGLTVSTLITLIVVPVLYAVMSKRGERDKQMKLRKKFVFLDKEIAETANIKIEDIKQ